MTDNDIITFGKHQGDKLCDVPANYLLWLADQDWLQKKFPDLAAYIEDNRNVLEEE